MSKAASQVEVDEGVTTCTNQTERWKGEVPRRHRQQKKPQEDVHPTEGWRTTGIPRHGGREEKSHTRNILKGDVQVAKDERKG